MMATKRTVNFTEYEVGSAELEEMLRERFGVGEGEPSELWLECPAYPKGQRLNSGAKASLKLIHRFHTDEAQACSTSREST